jgi:hypothetical protein
MLLKPDELNGGPLKYEAGIRNREDCLIVAE